MVNTKQNLIGMTFDRLTVLEQVEDYIKPNGVHVAQYLCECSCEEHNKVIRRGDMLKYSKTNSCGCLRKKTEYIPRLNRRKYNNYDMTNYDYGVGYTIKGEPFWFDKEDYDKIKNYCWYYNKNGYLVTRKRDVSGNKLISLHRLIMEPIENHMVVDHKEHLSREGYKFDNRKSNLRITTQANNAKNQAKRIDNTSGTTGVYWDKKNNKWYVKITSDNVDMNLGYFDNKNDAIVARKNAEIQYFGDNRYSAYNN